MQHVSLTPFGRQPVTSALLAARQQGSGAPALPRIDKWSLFTDLRTARAEFGVTDRDLSVLYALLTFLPGKMLADDISLVVFPSNATLSDRTHGMAESTLRRHLAALVAAGLIWRQDSPNGKRFARRDTNGRLSQAYGFDLRPLLTRSHDIVIAAAAVAAHAEEMRLAREALVLRLRDAAKLLAYGRALDVPGDWSGLEERLQPLRAALRRKLDLETLTSLDSQAQDILADTATFLALETSNPSGSAVHYERHYTESNQDSYESETCHEPSPPESEVPSPQPSAAGSLQHLPLHLVLRACPDIRPYARNNLGSWHDLVATASDLRGMMGVSVPVWAEAQKALGRESAAIVISAMLQRFDRISNPSGYLRALTSKALSAGFTPGPMIMALLRET